MTVTGLHSWEHLMSLRTRLTDAFNIRHPIVLAPMDPASGGALAAAGRAARGRDGGGRSRAHPPVAGEAGSRS